MSRDTGDDYVIAESLRLRVPHQVEAGGEAEPAEQVDHPVGKRAARRRVVDPWLRLRRAGRGHEDAAVGRPQVAQEGPYLSVVRRVELVGQLLLVRPESGDAELVEPRHDRITAPVGQPVRRGEVGVLPVALRDPPRPDAELGARGLLDEAQVRLVLRRVVHRLPGEHAAVAEQVREQTETLLAPAEAGGERGRDPPGDGDPVAGGEILQRHPPAEGAERVVA